MKRNNQRKVKGGQVSTQQSISNDLTRGKSFLKSSGGRSHKISGRKEAPFMSPRMSSEHGTCNLNKGSSSRTVNKMPTVVEADEGQIPHIVPKIKLQLFPLYETTCMRLQKDGHNPFLELTLRPRKKIPSIINHLQNKWGSSSSGNDALMLFPFNIVMTNLTSSRRWTSNDVNISAGDVYAAIGSPDIFRLRYEWGSSLSLGCTEPARLWGIASHNLENTVGSRHQTEVYCRDSKPCTPNEAIEVAVELPVLSKPPLVARSEVGAEDENFNANKTSEVVNDIKTEERTFAEQFKYEDPRLQNEVSLTSLIWSDLSNISIGGLLSEASLQGRFGNQERKTEGSRLSFQPAPVVSDSLDAFINQITCPEASATLSLNMPSSILDAEDTCHSFGVLKTSPSSGKDFLTLGRRAFSDLSNQSVAPRPFKISKTEANAKYGAAAKCADEEDESDIMPCSAGVFNNENSLGLSSIRWNDSLGPFDHTLTSRQIVKEDSISIGGFVR